MDINMSVVVERIKNICSIKELEKIGVHKGTVSAWRVNNSIPKIDIILSVAQFLNVSVEWLLTGSDKSLNIKLMEAVNDVMNNESSESESNMINNYRKLDEKSREVIDIIIEKFANSK